MNSNATENVSGQLYSNKVIILAGATGDLGKRIAFYLADAGASVRALVRKESNPEHIAILQAKGISVKEVDFENHDEVVQACAGGTCLVSAVNGLSDVIINLQTRLALAAIEAGVPRFIPSDFCIDYTRLQIGTNRNLDLRRQFNKELDGLPIASTSILNGMFSDLLTGEAPVVLFGLKRVVYWGDASQLLDFTTIDNTAQYTAYVAMQDASPRYLRIAGDVINADGLAESAYQATGKKFSLLRAGGLGGLQTMIKITRFLLPKKNEVFPPWQGMQYLHNMSTGLPKLQPLDNQRFPQIVWTSVREVLANRMQ